MTTTYRPTFLQQLCRWLYSALLAVVVPVVIVSSILKGKKIGQNRPSLGARFGLVKSAGNGGYWFHCVSVGEVVVASCIIKRILSDEPDERIVITTTTATGAARVGDIFADRVEHHYLPYDFSFAMRQLLARLRPAILVITEVELWPNLIDACWRHNIPVVVINARMTDRSARRYQKLSLLFKPMLLKISHVCAQGKRDYENYLALGIDPQKLTLTHNIKFDQVAQQSESVGASFMNIALTQRPVLVGGSTHEPEEAVLLQAARTLKETFPDLLLILVPRHPQRFNEIAHLLGQNGTSFVRSREHNTIPTDCSVVLVDEMGKLNLVYQVGSIAFVGGSIADRGGHNALEPAAAGLPILMGPSRHNNPEICHQLAQRDVLALVRDSRDIVNQSLKWLSQPEAALKCGERGREVIAQHAGASDSVLACIRSCLERNIS